MIINDKSVFAKIRTKQMPFGDDIFIDKKYNFNEKHIMNDLQLLDSIKPNSIPVVFFDPQYRGVLDKLSYGNEGKRQIKRAKLEQMDEKTIITFIKKLIMY